MRAGIYARIRYEDALELPKQVEALETFVRLKGWTLVLREAETETGSSGRLPARDRLLQAARHGDLDVIVV
jgi:DNA invertase Pin-like site-specific DNA recombinase